MHSHHGLVSVGSYGLEEVPVVGNLRTHSTLDSIEGSEEQLDIIN